MQYLHIGTKMPTYGELVDLLEDSERGLTCGDTVPDILYSKFKEAYPRIRIGRAKRFHTTIMRIAAPTRPSIRGESKLIGSPLIRYRRKNWIPRIRNPAGGRYRVLYCCNTSF